jgi:hypothetical protein
MQEITFPISSIMKVEVYKKDLGATITAHVLATLGIVAIPLAVGFSILIIGMPSVDFCCFPTVGW